MLKDKWLIIGIIATVILIAGGVFLMSRGSSSGAKQISSDILVPKNAYIAGGIVQGSYLPASSTAKLTLVEFGDYECPACIEYHPFVKQILSDFSGQVNYVFRNFPLSQHANAPISAYAAEAAGLQGKYWQMHDKIYESTTEWVASTDAKSIFIGYAGALGLDIKKFTGDIDSDAIKNKVQSDISDGNLVKLNATPTFYLNGVKVGSLTGSYANFKSIISAELSKTN
jgi:protein-disulfide isomerase